MPRNVEEPAPRRPPYFWWLLANGLALCFAVLSWVGCLYVFRNPEIPRNYEFLGKIGRLPELKRFTVLDVPNGNTIDPKQAYKQYINLPAEDLAALNSRLIRNYITNFDQPLLLTYIEGDYEVVESRPLDGSDFIPSGIAVRARAMVKPDEFTAPAPYPVVIEYLFPTDNGSMAGKFRPGDLLAVRKSPNCAAVLHVARITDGDETKVCLTVVPIAYGPYRMGEGPGLTIEPPGKVNPGVGLPVFAE